MADIQIEINPTPNITVELAPAQNITVSLNASTSDSASILSQVLTGLNTALTGAITASDTILQAFGRVAWALTWRMPKHAITIGYDSSCDIVYNSTQDFTVKMLEAIDLALTSSTFDTPRKIIVKRGTYFQDTVLDLPFDPRLAIEGMPRWETAFGTAGVLVQWRGTGYAGVAPYQVSLDMPDVGFDSSKEAGGFYFNRCNFNALGDGTPNNFAWIKGSHQTQSWVSNCWFANSTGVDYGFHFDTIDKLKMANCEFNNVKTSLFYLEDSSLVPLSDITVSGCVYLPGNNVPYVTTNFVNASSTNISLTGAFRFNNGVANVHLGSNTTGVTMGQSSGYPLPNSDNNELIRYVYGRGFVPTQTTITDNGALASQPATANSTEYWRINDLAGNEVFTINTTNRIIRANQRIQVGDGSPSTPSVSFLNQTNKGLYNPLSNQVGMAVASALVQLWTATGSAITGTFSATGNITGANLSGTNTGDQDLSGYALASNTVQKSDYTPAHSLLVQQSGTGTPTALQIGNNTIVGRLSGGGSNINDLSASDVRTLLSIDNVDNTTDLNKPISTATQTALNLKQDTLVSGTNIKTINGASVLGSGDLTVGGLTEAQAKTIARRYAVAL